MKLKCKWLSTLQIMHTPNIVLREIQQETEYDRVDPLNSSSFLPGKWTGAKKKGGGSYSKTECAATSNAPSPLFILENLYKSLISWLGSSADQISWNACQCYRWKARPYIRTQQVSFSFFLSNILTRLNSQPRVIVGDPCLKCQAVGLNSNQCS